MNQFQIYLSQKLDGQIIDAGISINDFLFDSFHTRVTLLKKTWVEEIRPVLTEKYEFEYRYRSTKTNIDV